MSFLRELEIVPEDDRDLEEEEEDERRRIELRHDVFYSEYVEGRGAALGVGGGSGGGGISF